MLNRIFFPVCAVVCGLAVVCVSASAPAGAIRLRLRFDARGPIPTAVRDGAIAEAARIWAPYGVVLDAAEGVACGPAAATLRVVFDAEPAGDEEEGSLGVLRFGGDGVPSSTMALHYESVARLISTQPVMGLDASHWPARLRDEILGRAVGRTMAHEVGHFLLRWPHHAESGLMRREYRASALVDPDLTAFGLTPIDRARLQIVEAAEVFAAAPAQIADAAACRLIAFNSSAAH